MSMSRWSSPSSAPEDVLLFHSALASATGFKTACEEAALQMLMELWFMFDTRLHTSAYRHLLSHRPGTRQSVYLGTSSASDQVGCQDLYLLTTMDALYSVELHRVEEGDVVIQTLRSENEDLRCQLLLARSTHASPRPDPRIKRTARKVIGRPSRLQLQPPQLVLQPAEQGPPIGDAKSATLDIEIAP
ncbi:hypothetical protein GUJ93_ZPchr0002g26330 [Zizania palustris]|uniref:Uncharacterized protein n=1 Tax=Zizania palustris TaxID=103762 RepID=A0A8J5RZV8_ZIZPA|nr:hypothetical protein GUJ93_ZPchr0002g26330 [Zizania palustris]